jgi:hypothetical protein
MDGYAYKVWFIVYVRPLRRMKEYGRRHSKG